MLGRVERRWRVQVTKRCLSEVDKVRAGGADVVVLGPGPEGPRGDGCQRHGQQSPHRRAGDVAEDPVEALRDPDKVGLTTWPTSVDARIRPRHAARSIALVRRRCCPRGHPINAVTSSLRKQHPDADDEELEFLATKAAEETSTVAAMTTGQRRATLAVDLPADATEPCPVRPAPEHDRRGSDHGLGSGFVDDLQWYAVDEIAYLT